MGNSYDQKPWLRFYSQWVPKELPIPSTTAIYIFEEAVSRRFNAPAIYYFDKIITYGELNLLANSLATALFNLGLRKGERIALSLQNVPQFLISQYAAWKLGAIVVPLNPMYKERELEYLLNDCKAKILIGLESTYPYVEGIIDRTPVEKVITTSDLDFLEAQFAPKFLADFTKAKPAETLDLMELLKQYYGSIPPRESVSPDDIAHLIYTSGTTGPPKGAMITHRNIVFNALVYKTICNLDTSDVVLGVAPLFHVTGAVAHLAVASLVGIPVVIFYRFDAAEALRLIEKWRASFTVGSITVFISLFNCPDFRQRDLSSFCKVYSGGAPVPAAFVDKFERASGIYIHNVYGLTETTSPSHMCPLGVRAPIDPQSGALSIGLPVPNTSAKIVDIETGTIEMPPNEIGEIIIKGPMVIPGYWDKPEETAHTIRNGWLYTGDVGKMDEDGWFYVIDRKKDLINVSGFKVWPREVEDVLYQHPAVREASVIGVPDPYRGETVKAFVVLAKEYEGKISPEELIEFCRQRMAAYKYPRIIEITSEIPKTSTGKFLRRALKDKELKKEKA